MAFTLESSAFKANDMIPTRFTCDASNASPPLSWKGAPSTTQSFVLIMDDPDAPRGTWVHWVLFNIPASTTQLTEGNNIPQGATGAKNSWNDNNYGGPCPPSGTHRYFFKLYALDIFLKLDANADKETVLKAMQGHVLASAELMGKYQRMS